MSEFDFNRAEQELFGEDELFAEGSVMDDPDITRETAKARELNVILRETSISFAEAMSIQADLDSGIEHWRESKVSVTGRIIPEKGVSVTPASSNGVMLYAKKLGFDGFTVLANFSDDETEVAPGAKIHYVFSVPAKLFNENLTGKAGRELVTAHGDLDQCLVDPRIITPERGLRWLKSVAPDLLEDIDATIYNSQGAPGSELLALKDLSLGLYEKYLEDDFTRECIEQYVKQLINFDTSMPYSLGIDGEVRLKYGSLRQGDFETIKKGVLAALFGPYLRPSNDENTKWQFQVEAALYLPDETAKDIPPLVQFNADQCKTLFSMRAVYYDK